MSELQLCKSPDCNSSFPHTLIKIGPVEHMGTVRIYLHLNLAENLNPTRIIDTHCPNVFTTPITAMRCWQCLPLSVVQLKGKLCRKPHCRNGVVDTFGHILIATCNCLRLRYRFFQSFEGVTEIISWNDNCELCLINSLTTLCWAEPTIAWHVSGVMNEMSDASISGPEL